MSRVNPADVGLPAGCRVDKAGSAVGFEDLHVRLPRAGRACPKCGQPMIGHGSYTRTVSHAVGHAPCKLEVTVPRYRCKRCSVTESEGVSFASALGPGISAALEERVLELLQMRLTMREAAMIAQVTCDTVKLVIDGARSRLQRGAGNGAEIKRRAHKLAVNRGKRSREHAGKHWVELEKRITCDVLQVCDEKHSHLRQMFLAMQLYYEWQDREWGDREACDKALFNWVMKASSLPVPEFAAFARTVGDHSRQLVTASIGHVSSARAESANNLIKELKRRSRGFGGFDETRKRLLIALGKPGAVEGATARARRKAAARAAHDARAAGARDRKKKRRR